MADVDDRLVGVDERDYVTIKNVMKEVHKEHGSVRLDDDSRKECLDEVAMVLKYFDWYDPARIISKSKNDEHNTLNNVGGYLSSLMGWEKGKSGGLLSK